MVVNFSLPFSFISDARLVYCDNTASGSCCTKSMELKLAGASRNQLERNTKDLIGKLASVLSTRAARFNGMFHMSAGTHAATRTHP